ncbi:hypothetical protein, partial [Paraburkholderia caribensis]|uniref:hypothetical protein n=1 Tax=Paraburkholderia caribensis TaxID=75105 RepID=UPI003F575289
GCQQKHKQTKTKTNASAAKDAKTQKHHPGNARPRRQKSQPLEGFPPYPLPKANLYDDPMTWQIH